MIIDTRGRTLVKTLTWRAMSLTATVGLVWAWTGRAAVAMAVGGAEALAKMALYYVHERGWTRIAFGRRAIEPAVIWITGLSGAGKTTLARDMESALRARGLRVEHLDGQRVRRLFPLTGFTPDERREHIRRVGMLASILESNGTFVVASLVSPHADARQFARSICRRFVEVHVSTPLAVCEQNDVTGLYARARAGEIKNMVGIDVPYEEPLSPEVRVNLAEKSSAEAVQLVLEALTKARAVPQASALSARDIENVAAPFAEQALGSVEDTW